MINQYMGVAPSTFTTLFTSLTKSWVNCSMFFPSCQHSTWCIQDSRPSLHLLRQQCSNPLLLPDGDLGFNERYDMISLVLYHDILSSPKSVDGSYQPHTWHHTCTQMMQLQYFNVSIKPSVSRYSTNVLSWFEWPVKHDMFSSFSSHPSTSAGGIESIRHKFTNDWSSICATSPSSSLVLTFTMDSKRGSLASPWTFTTKVWWRDHATLLVVAVICRSFGWSYRQATAFYIFYCLLTTSI